MKINSISLRFSDVNDDVARLEVVLDPDEAKLEDLEDQPCLELANQVIAMLHWQQEKAIQETQEANDQGKTSPTVH